jgi:hypothetical protein
MDFVEVDEGTGEVGERHGAHPSAMSASRRSKASSSLEASLPPA